MAKGGSYEREVAKILTRWLNPDGSETPIQLWRSNLSGGWSEKDRQDVGDLAPKEMLGHEFRSFFGVECKHWKDISMWGLFTHEYPTIIEWWDKITIECAEYGLAPLLIMKRSRYTTLLGSPIGLFPVGMWGRQMHLPHAGLALTLFDEFIERLTPEEAYGWVDKWKA